MAILKVIQDTRAMGTKGGESPIVKTSIQLEEVDMSKQPQCHLIQDKVNCLSRSNMHKTLT